MYEPPEETQIYMITNCNESRTNSLIGLIISVRQATEAAQRSILLEYEAGNHIHNVKL